MISIAPIPDHIRNLDSSFICLEFLPRRKGTAWFCGSLDQQHYFITASHCLSRPVDPYRKNDLVLTKGSLMNDPTKEIMFKSAFSDPVADIAILEPVNPANPNYNVDPVDETAVGLKPIKVRKIDHPARDIRCYARSVEGTWLGGKCTVTLAESPRYMMFLDNGKDLMPNQIPERVAMGSCGGCVVDEDGCAIGIVLETDYKTFIAGSLIWQSMPIWFLPVLENHQNLTNKVRAKYQVVPKRA